MVSKINFPSRTAVEAYKTAAKTMKNAQAVAARATATVNRNNQTTTTQAKKTQDLQTTLAANVSQRTSQNLGRNIDVYA